MKKIKINKGDKEPNFIGCWMIEPNSICDDLINYFEENPNKQNAGGTENGIITSIKDSTDITIKPKEILIPGNELFKLYFEYLFECYKNYIDEWDFLKNLGSNLEIGYFNLQKYKPGQHFNKIHTERFSLKSAHRVFAFMTYLNDVLDGGSTYFSHYDIEIKPKKGLTLIWPAEWTHAHKGNIIKEGNKYIITGWLNFSV